MRPEPDQHRAPADLLPALNAIMHRDPDGGQHEPTEADYAAHRAWALEAYGPEVWAVYTAGGWDDPADEPRHVEY